MDIFFDTSVGSAVSHLHLRKSFSYKAILHMLWSKYEYISQYLLICHFPLNSNQHKHSQDESILINFSKSRLVFCESVYIFVWFYFIILGFEVFHFYPELHYFIHLQGFWLLYIIYFRIFFSIYIQPLFSFFFYVFFSSCMYLKLSCCIIFSSHYWLISHLWRALTHIT